MFLAAFAWDRIRRRELTLPRSAATVAGFMLVFLAVYLCGYFDLQNQQALTFWIKGIGAVDWCTSLFLMCGVALTWPGGGRRLFMRRVRWFTAECDLGCVYGMLQLCGQIGGGDQPRSRSWSARSRPGKATSAASTCTGR